MLIEELLQLYDMREVNEGLCARLAAHNARGETWDDLIETFGDNMADIVERNDFDAYSIRRTASAIDWSMSSSLVSSNSASGACFSGATARWVSRSSRERISASTSS